MNLRRCAFEEKTSTSEPKSPEILTTSNPDHGGDTVSRRTSDSATVRRQNDSKGNHWLRFVGIEIASELIEMPFSSRKTIQSAPTATRTPRMPAKTGLRSVVALKT